jgi:hypothetical protein
MKRFLRAAAYALILVVCTTVLTTNAAAQGQSVYELQIPIVTMGGDFNNGTADTSIKKWALTANTSVGTTATASFPCFYTRVDSVQHTAALNDSVNCRLSGYYHSVGFQISATRSGSVACDSTKFYIWGSKRYYGYGNDVLLTSFTMANNATEQVFNYEVNNGVGNPFTTYRVTAICGNLALNSTVLWNSTILVR